MRTIWTIGKYTKIAALALLLVLVLSCYGLGQATAYAPETEPVITGHPTGSPTTHPPTITVSTNTTTTPTTTGTGKPTSTKTPSNTSTSQPPRKKSTPPGITNNPNVVTTTVYRNRFRIRTFFLRKDPRTIFVAGQTVTQYVTVGGSGPTKTMPGKTMPGKVKFRHKTVTLTVVKFIGYSILVFILGVAAAVLASWLSFIWGWRSGDDGNRDFLREIRDGLKYPTSYTKRH